MVGETLEAGCPQQGLTSQNVYHTNSRRSDPRSGGEPAIHTLHPTVQMFSGATYGALERGKFLRALRYIVVASTALVAITAGVLGPAAPSHADGCDDYLFLGARGSGESAREYSAPTYGLGTPLAASYAALAQLMNAAGQTIHAEGVVYPAVRVDGLDGATLNALPAMLGINGTFMKSVQAGAEAARGQIERSVQTCPSTKVVIGGYSQGAMAVDRMVSALPSKLRDSIYGVMLYGDPQFNAEDSLANRSTYDIDHHGLFGPHQKWEELVTLPTAVKSYCRIADPICNITKKYKQTGLVNFYYRDIGFVANYAKAHGEDLFSQHTRYQDAAQQDAAEMARSLGINVASKKLAPRVLYRYAVNFVDWQGREKEVLDKLRDTANSVASENPNALFAFAGGYTTSGYDGRPWGYSVQRGFDQDRTLVDDPALESYSIDGFNTVLDRFKSDVLDHFMPGSSWNVDAFDANLGKVTRIDRLNDASQDIPGQTSIGSPQPPTNLIFVSKQGPSDMFTRDYIKKYALQLGTSVSVVSLDDLTSRRTVSSTAWADVPSVTGGVSMSGPSALNDASVAALRAPNVKAGIPSTGEAGKTVPLSFDASGSDWEDGVESVRWDFGDGQTTESSDTTIEHAWATPGEYTVVAVPVSTTGTGKTFSQVITVTAPANTPPKAPEVSADSGEHNVSLSWANPDGATLYQIVDEQGKQVDAFSAVPGKSKPQEWTSPDMPIGTTSSYVVRAFNSQGVSPDSAVVTATTAYPSALRVGDSIPDSQLSLNGGASAWTGGAFVCDAEDSVSGAIEATGDVTLRPGCNVGSDIVSGGDVSVETGASVGGSVRASGSVTLSADVTVGGDVRSAGAVHFVEEGAGTRAQIGGTVEEHSSTEAPSGPPPFSSDVPDATQSLAHFLRSGVNDPEAITADGSEQCGLSGEVATLDAAVVDATACANVELDSVHLKLEGDLTLYVQDLSVIGSGLAIESPDGLDHSLRVESVSGGTMNLSTDAYAWDGSSVELATGGVSNISGLAVLNELTTGQLVNSGNLVITR